MANIKRVMVVASDSGAIGPSTATVTSVDSATSSTTLLAANPLRRGATITNTDAHPLLVHLGGGTASATAYSVRLAQDDYYEVPYGYTGAITGIWTTDGTGAALVTEFA